MDANGKDPDGLLHSIEMEKLGLERERLAIERERLEHERLRYSRTVELAGSAAGKVVIPASTFALVILLSLIIGGAFGVWHGAAKYRHESSSLAHSVARAIGAPSGSHTNSPAGGVLLDGGKGLGGRGYLLILD